jgi:hypothetical protein
MTNQEQGHLILKEYLINTEPISFRISSVFILHEIKSTKRSAEGEIMKKSQIEIE